MKKSEPTLVAIERATFVGVVCANGYSLQSASCFLCFRFPERAIESVKVVGDVSSELTGVLRFESQIEGRSGVRDRCGYRFVGRVQDFDFGFMDLRAELPFKFRELYRTLNFSFDFKRFELIGFDDIQCFVWITRSLDQ